MGKPALNESQPRRMTVQEYLAIEEKSATKHEFWNGTMVAMAGAIRDHVILTSQAVTALNRRLDGTSCQAGSSDLRVKTNESGDYVYPDVVVWCDDAQWDEASPMTLVTPLVIIEVLSPSTAPTDRREKLERYQQIPSLTDYLIFSTERVSIEHYARGEGDAWIYRHLTGRDQTVRLTSLSIEIPVAELYRRLNVPEGLRLLNETSEQL